MSKATHLLRKASELVKQRKYADAVEVYLQATETAPSDSRAWFGLGVCLYKIGNLEVARIALERAQKMGYPRAAEALARVEEAERRRDAEGAGAKAAGGRSRRQQAAGAGRTEPAPAERARGEKIELDSFLRVMVVENIESDRQNIVHALEDVIEDIEVTCRPYGVSTSDTMSGTVHYDVAVLDWDSDPDAAAGLIQILKIKRPSLFIVCLTEEWDAEAAAQIFEAGADYNLVKDEDFSSVLPLTIARWARRDRAMALQMRAKSAEEQERPWPEEIDVLGEMLVLVAGDYTVLRANQAALKGFKRGEEQFVGRSYARVFYGLEEPPDSCPLLRALQTGAAADGDTRIEETGKTLHIKAWPITSYAGKVTHAVGLMRESEAQPVSENIMERERLYRSLVERANAGLAMVGPEGTVRYANQSICGMLDHTVDELLDRPVESIVTPEDQESLRECIEIAVDIGESGSRLDLLRAGAHKVPVEARLGRLTSDSQTFLILTCVEVRDLEEAEQELWGETKRLAGILDEGMDKLECGVIVLDAEGRITWSNGLAADLLGSEKDSLVGRDYLDLLAETLSEQGEGAEDFLDTVRAVREEGEPLREVMLRLGSDGPAIRYWSSPVTGMSSAVARVEHFYPATEASAVEAAAGEGEDLPAGMAEAVPDMLFSTDCEGRITWCNPAAATTSGYSKSRLEGMDLTELAADDARNKLRSLVQNVINSGRQIRRQEVLVNRGDGNPFWAELTLLPMRNGQDSEVQGLQGVLRDVTDRKVNDAIRSLLEGETPA
ncbi:MAG: PAS domain S-box protein [Candidatus Brocadiaceae bacterium]|jgi:PAS domain S-box-containing protein